MPVTIEFIKEDRVVLQTYSDPLDGTQMNDLRKKMDLEILPSATHKLHIIADFRQVRNLPGTILSSGARMMGSAHFNTGDIVFVSQSVFISRMGKIFSQLASQYNFHSVTSLDEAFAVIDQLLAKEHSTS